MKPQDLEFSSLTAAYLAPYSKRAPSASEQFLLWFLESIFRLDQQDADDACVDKRQDKGVDGIFVNDSVETIYLFQSKIKQSEGGKLGDTDLKEFWGTLTQFQSTDTIQVVLNGGAHEGLKAAIQREKLIEKLDNGYTVEGVFCCNVDLNSDGRDYLKTCPELIVYDATRISEEYVELDSAGGIKEVFKFDTSDTEVIKYRTAEAVSARIFLADALQLTHMKGISDGSLFQQNVRLDLGNTKVNKSLLESMRAKEEHKNFPLYHNGITILCEEIEERSDFISVKNYVVVNGAQSLTSLQKAKSSLTSDLKILVKVVALQSNAELTDKITINSNNQNATKPRDMRSNHDIQRRIKKEVDSLNYKNLVYEIKRGEANQDKIAVSNEDAGLAVLALDLGEPWSCHQKYKVMDESHGKIFGRPDVIGSKIVVLSEAIKSLNPVLDEFKESQFGHYNLTRFFLAHAVAEIIKDDERGKMLFANFDPLFKHNQIEQFLALFTQLASTTVDDLNVEISELSETGTFDYKSDLKSPKWCRQMTEKLKATYKKDVKRKKAEPIGELLVAFDPEA